MSEGGTGSRQWLLSQMKHGIHVEERATVLHGRCCVPSAVVLLNSHLSGLYKPHAETLQQLLSSGVDISTSFEIRLADIVDIKARRDFMAHREMILGKECPEVVYIFFNKSESYVACCTVYTTTLRFSKILLCLWQAHIVRRALNVRFRRAIGSEEPITREYYLETVQSLKLAECRSDMIDVLQEFASECQADGTLKLLAFETMDIFIILQHICRGALFQTEPGKRSSFCHAELLWASCLDMVVDRGTEDTRALQLSKDKAAAELLERFRLYHACLNVLVSLLFGTDVVHLQHRLISGPSPLSLTSWLPVVACDVHSLLSETLGFEASAKGLEEVGGLAMEEEILRSVQSLNSSLSGRSSTQMGLGTEDFLQTEFLRGSTDIPRGGSSRTILALNPGATSGENTDSFSLQRRVQRQLVFACAASDELISVRQSTLDLQGLFLSFICDMTAFGANQHPRPSNQVEERVARVPQGIVVSVAECFIRVPHWGLFLEHLVVRCGVIIDDFMNAECVSTELRKQNMEKTPPLRQKKDKEDASGAIRNRLTGKIVLPAAPSTSGNNDIMVPTEESKKRLKQLPSAVAASSGHSVRFDESVDVREWSSRQRQIQNNRSENVGFLPVAMSPKKARKPFRRGAADAKERSGSFLGRRSNENSRSTRNGSDTIGSLENRNIDPADSRGPLLETQEVLIFYFTHLICFLANDSPQMRRYLESDLKDYIVSIVCCLRYLCPLKSQYQAVLIASAAATALNESKQKSGPAPDDKNAAGGKQVAKKEGEIAITAVNKKILNAKAIADNDTGKNKTSSEIDIKKDKYNSANISWPLERLELTTDTRSQKRMQCALAEFEEARFGLTDSAWKLMLLSSLQLENAFDSVLDSVPSYVDHMFAEEDA